MNRGEQGGMTAGEVVLAKALAFSEIEHCKSCGGISDPITEHDTINMHWIACKDCGEAFHRSCIHSERTAFTEPVPLKIPCPPTALSSEINWTCHGCRYCHGCKSKGSGKINECYQCQKSFCTDCRPKSHGSLWEGLFWVCQSCKPACVSCEDALPESRRKDSRWCLDCKRNWLKGCRCPGCSKAYAEEEEGEHPMIQCGSCSIWVHYACTGMAVEDLKKLEKNSSANYFCTTCSKDDQITHVQLCHGCHSSKNKNPPQESKLVPLKSKNGPTIWSHQSCFSYSEHFLHTGKKPESSNESFFVRTGIRTLSSDKQTLILRYWARHQCGRQNVVVTRTGDSLHFTSSFELISKLKERLELYRSTSAKKKAKLVYMLQEELQNLISSPASKKPKTVAAKKKEPKPSVPKNAIIDDNKENISQSPVEIEPEPVIEDGLCARTRALPYSEMLATKRQKMGMELSLYFKQHPHKTLPFNFNVNAVPMRTNEGRYRTVPLPMAYRNLTSTIKRGDLVVAKSKIAGHGLFTTRRYLANELIIEYVGEVISQALADKREAKDYGQSIRHKDSCYMFRLDNHRVIDATLIGNQARFINHCCQPNCRTRPWMIEGEHHILVIAKRDIQAGEELTYDYLFALDEDGKGRIPCYCGAPKCRGWMN